MYTPRSSCDSNTLFQVNCINNFINVSMITGVKYECDALMRVWYTRYTKDCLGYYTSLSQFFTLEDFYRLGGSAFKLAWMDSNSHCAISRYLTGVLVIHIYAKASCPMYEGCLKSCTIFLKFMQQQAGKGWDSQGTLICV